MFTSFYRQLFCWIDRWYDLTLDEALKYEQTVYQGSEDGFQYFTAPGRTRSTQSSGLLNSSLFHYRRSRHKHQEKSSKLQIKVSKIDHDATFTAPHDLGPSLSDVTSENHERSSHRWTIILQYCTRSWIRGDVFYTLNCILERAKQVPNLNLSFTQLCLNEYFAVRC